MFTLEIRHIHVLNIEEIDIIDFGVDATLANVTFYVVLPNNMHAASVSEFALFLRFTCMKPPNSQRFWKYIYKNIYTYIHILVFKWDITVHTAFTGTFNWKHIEPHCVH